jgi:hypothetical protein
MEARLQELADRQDIADVLHRYALALDGREWEALASCFLPDGVADYGDLGGVNEGRDAIVALCRGALEGLDASQHLIGTVAIEVDGDTATATCYLQAQHVLRGARGGDNFLVGGTYRDRLVRTGSGWQIEHRTLEGTWQDGNPGVFEQGTERLRAGA